MLQLWAKQLLESKCVPPRVQWVAGSGSKGACVRGGGACAERASWVCSQLLRGGAQQWSRGAHGTRTGSRARWRELRRHPRCPSTPDLTPPSRCPCHSRREEVQALFAGRTFAFSIIVHSDTQGPFIDFHKSSPILNIRADCPAHDLIQFMVRVGGGRALIQLVVQPMGGGGRRGKRPRAH